jgi:sugar phosphate isomerase/epimerase
MQAAIAGQVTTPAAAARPLGVQLYTVRDQMRTDPAATLKAIADIGYKEVEVLYPGLAETCRLARQVGLSPVSVHIDAHAVTGDWPAANQATPSQPAVEQYTIETATTAAKAQGISYLVVSYVARADREKPGFFESFGKQLNRAGESVKNAGLQLCYHNHGFEFEKRPDGRSHLDVLMAAVKPDLVKLELDVFWVSVTGADPAKLINQYSGRVALMHLKDKARGVAAETDEGKVAKTSFTEVGNGSLDFPDILKAARAAGVEHFFVEQDHTPGDPIASLRKSYTYLQQQLT